MRLFECDKGWEKGWILREFGLAPLKAYVNIYGLSQAAGVITEAVLYRGSRMENAEHMSMSGLLAENISRPLCFMVLAGRCLSKLMCYISYRGLLGDPVNIRLHSVQVCLWVCLSPDWIDVSAA